MLIEIAIADAACAPFEFKDAKTRSRFTQARYHTPDGVGRYTDDTQMTLAVCEHMLSGSPNTQEAWAEHFIEAYRRDPRAGYSRRTASALSQSSPRRMLAASGDYGRRGNGSVMRCVPLGMYGDPEEVLARCLVQSTVTHSSFPAAMAACSVALASHYIYHGWESAPKMFAFLKAHMGSGINGLVTAWREGTEVPCDAVQTASYCLRLAATALEKRWPLESCVDHAVHDGGDVDSTAAVSTGLASMRRIGVPKLPVGAAGALVQNLENGPFGRDRLIEVDALMAAKFPRTHIHK